MEELLGHYDLGLQFLAAQRLVLKTMMLCMGDSANRIHTTPVVVASEMKGTTSTTPLRTTIMLIVAQSERAFRQPQQLPWVGQIQVQIGWVWAQQWVVG